MEHPEGLKEWGVGVAGRIRKSGLLSLSQHPRSLLLLAFQVSSLRCNDNDNNDETLNKREPLVYTRARRAVQKKEEKKKRS